jgi:hypothetical protein
LSSTSSSSRVASWSHNDCESDHWPLCYQDLRYRYWHQRRIGDRTEFHQPYAVAIRVDDFGRHLQCEPGLADATDADERHQPLARQQPLDLHQLALAADE